MHILLWKTASLLFLCGIMTFYNATEPDLIKIARLVRKEHQWNNMGDITALASSLSILPTIVLLLNL